MASLDAVASPPAGLEPRFYQDPEVLALEDERIFSRTWQFVAHVAQLSEPGRYLTASAGSQPVLVLRDPEGELRAFRNVCRHRGSQLLSGSGECGKAIRCRYHGWTYRLEGDLIGVPEARSIPGLDKSALGLFPVAGRGDVRPDLRQPRRGRHPARRAGRRPARAPCALPLRGADPEGRGPLRPAGQLEGRGRQLPRGLPRADRPPGADAPPRLQELRRRAARQLGLVQRSAPRQALRQPHGAHLSAHGRADAGPGRRTTSTSGASS